MATTGNILCRAANCVQKILLKDSSFNLARILTCQPNRHRRRTTKPPAWFPTKTPRQQSCDVTEDNEQFLNQLNVDKYKAVVESPLKKQPWKREEWTFRTKRTGLLAVKLGLTVQWDRQGRRLPVTVLQVIDNHVINYTSPDRFMKTPAWKPWWRSQYGRVVVGALSDDPSKYSKEYNDLFLKAGVPTKRRLTRFLVTPNAAIQPGIRLTINHFRIGDYVDCQAKSIDHGFQGVVKRWGFKGGRATHGNTKNMRGPGSTGAGRRCSGIIKGKKLPGHMGGDWKAEKGLQIIRMNTKYNLIYVKGNCPGPTHCYVRIMDTVLPNRRNEMLQNPPSMPTTFPEDIQEVLPEELFHDSVFQFTEPSITFAVEEEVKKKK